MANPYVGEIRMFGGNFAPLGWLFCDGQLLQIGEFETLFQLIGTTYGGDGIETFALPDLRGRLALHRGPGYAVAQSGGTETVTLTATQIPLHGHTPMAQSTQGDQAEPTGAVWASSLLNQFIDASPDVFMRNDPLLPAGQNQPHDNMMPFLAISFIIAFTGIFPSPI